MSTTVARTDMLFEREEALAALERAYDEARDGSGRLVLVAGEAGVGKSALVRAFTAAAESSARVLEGACDPLFTPRPLGPFADVAAAIGGELEELVAGGAIPHRIASVVLQELGREPGTIVVLEDVHWADEATLDVLRIVARRLESEPVLVVATYRDDELGPTHPLRIVLGGLATISWIRRAQLAPLSPGGVASLAEPFETDAGDLYRLTSGNPFFVTEVLAAGTRDVPVTVRDAVLARSARLSPEGRSVLEAVSVVPSTAELWLLEALDEPVDDGLSECLAAGMLTSDGGQVAFRHELARLTIEESLAPKRRAALNRSVLEALTGAPAAADFARLAHHADAAGDTDAVLRYAPEAAVRSASLGAHRESAAQYRRALRFADGLPLRERASLLERYSGACYLTDEFDEAIESLEAAVDSYRELGDRTREGASLAELANALWCRGRAQDARRVGLEAVAVLESMPAGPELAHAYDTVAFLHRMNADLANARIWIDRAVGLADELEPLDGPTLDWVHSGVDLLNLASGSNDALRAIEESIAVAHHTARDDGTAGLTVALVKMLTFTRHLSRARRHIEQGLVTARHNGNDLAHVYLLAFRSRLQLNDGDWDHAAESAHLALGERFVSTMPRTIALVTLALVRARRGDPDVWPLLDEARELSESTGELPRMAPVAAARAEVAWLTGRSEIVAGETDDAFALACERRIRWPLGELATARRRAGLVDPVPDELPEPHAYELAGRWYEAAAAWRRLSHPYEAALALAEGDERAQRQALEELAALGAGPGARIVARRLREGGVRGIPVGPRAATRANAAGLTAREQEVLRLMADGLQNAQIADQLFLSRRTIDHHVSAVLRKVDAKTRGEAVAYARREGLLERP